jgi:uncharacterized protein (UPF0332 family)
MKEEIKELSIYWMNRADEAMASAELELDNGFFNGTVNRLYYSLFYAVSSLLALKEVKFGKHTAVRSWLNLDLVKKGVLSLEEGKLYNRLFYDEPLTGIAPETGSAESHGVAQPSAASAEGFEGVFRVRTTFFDEHSYTVT